MRLRNCVWQGGLGLMLLALLATALPAQGGPPWAGRGGMGRGMGRGMAQGNRGAGRGPAWGRQGNGTDSQFVSDRDVFHSLLQNHDKIRREVKNVAKGVETITESDSPEVATKIQEHVAAMAKRVEEGRPIHMRDPLFAELFRNASKIQLKYEKTAKGISVVETSDDPHVAQVIQAHGGVVSLFVKNGFDEAHKNHDIPGAGSTAAVATERGTVAVACPAGANCPQAKTGPACVNCPAAKANAGCAGCPQAKTCPAAVNCPNCKSCPAGAGCPQGQACPAGANCAQAKTGPACVNCPAAKANAGCAGCPQAKSCPAAVNCPNCKSCPAGAGCPQGQACPAGANCAQAKTGPACVNCPAAKANAGCAGCPQAKSCPVGANCPQAKTCPAGTACPNAAGAGCTGGACPLKQQDMPPPLPKTPEKKAAA